MPKIDPRHEKALANAAYALKYETRGKKRVSRKTRKRRERHARIELRELRWLAASGIERDERFPLA